MSSINKTPHYNLSQFGDSPDDKPSWRGDYTGDMSRIDSQMYRNERDATTATSTANTARNTADNALSMAQTNKNDIAEQESYFNALGVTSEPTAQALMSTINGKAEDTALTTLRGTVSSLSGTVGTKANSSDVYTKSQADARYTQQGGYAGTASTIYEMASGAQSGITNLQSTVTNLQSTGVAPIQVISQDVLTDYFTNGACKLTAYYSPISRMMHVMLRIGTAEGVAVTPKKAYPRNLGTKIATIDERYRPTVSIQAPTQSISNPNTLSNILILPTGEVKFWGGASGLSTSATINTTFQTTYFIIR